MEKLFVLYDGRAKTDSVDNASVYVTASSEQEAQEDGQDTAWQDGLWYEYDCIGGELKNGRPRWDIAPNNVMLADRLRRRVMTALAVQGDTIDNKDRETIQFLRDQNVDLNNACRELKTALKQCIKVLRKWHGHDAFEIYYDHSPEMKKVRKVLPGFRVTANKSIQATEKNRA